jgi:hypothetical protein
MPNFVVIPGPGSGPQSVDFSSLRAYVTQSLSTRFLLSQSAYVRNVEPERRVCVIFSLGFLVKCTRSYFIGASWEPCYFTYLSVFEYIVSRVLQLFAAGGCGF